VSARQFQIFYLHVLREIPVREVARQLGVSIGAVYLAKHRVGRSWRRQLEILRAAES
jgi:DNA-directed RNA polymerase specialized sigma24 family protein